MTLISAEPRAWSATVAMPELEQVRLAPSSSCSARARSARSLPRAHAVEVQCQLFESLGCFLEPLLSQLGAR